MNHSSFTRPYQLRHDPEGWDNQGHKLKRDPSWHGVMFEYSPKLKFVKDGRDVLHYLYETYGIEAGIDLIVEEKNSLNHKFERVFKGRLNLDSLVIEKLYASCNAERDDFTIKINNRKDVKVNLLAAEDQDGNALPALSDEDVELHSKVLRRVFEATGTKPHVFDPSVTSSGTYYLMWGWGSVNAVTEVMRDLTVDEIAERFDYPTQISTIDPREAKKYYFKLKEGGLYDFDFKINALVNDTLTARMHDWTMKWYFTFGNIADGYVTEQIDDEVVTNDASSITGEFIYQASKTLKAGDELYIFGELTLAVDTSVELIGYFPSLLSRTEINITADTQVPATSSPLVLLHEAVDRVLESISGKREVLHSEYYGRTDLGYAADGAGALRGFANGAVIRGFPKAERPMFMSLKEVMDCLQAIDAVGLGIERVDGAARVVLAPLEYFYKPVEVMQLNYVQDIVKKVASEHYYTEAEVGYTEWQNEEINNLDEFNTLRKYGLPISIVSNVYKAVSSIIASGYTLEFVRRERFDANETKDNQRDNSNFIIALRRDGGDYITDKDEDFAVLAGLISPETVYNAKLSPLRMLLKHYNQLGAGLQKYVNKVLRVNYFEGSVSMQSRLSTEDTALSEGAPLPIQQLARPLWLGEYYEFSAAPSAEQIQALYNEPYGYISFSDTNKNYKHGYVAEVSKQPDSRMMDFKLLRANL